MINTKRNTMNKNENIELFSDVPLCFINQNTKQAHKKNDK